VYPHNLEMSWKGKNTKLISVMLSWKMNTHHHKLTKWTYFIYDIAQNTHLIFQPSIWSQRSLNTTCVPSHLLPVSRTAF
jgi:hypothetical protein